MTIRLARVSAFVLIGVVLLGACQGRARPTGEVFVSVRPAGAPEAGQALLSGAAVVARQGSRTVASQPLQGLAAPPLVLAPGRYSIEVTRTSGRCDRVEVTVSESQRVEVTLNCEVG